MTAIEKLKQLTVWDADPVLTEDDLGGVLAAAALMDANGLAPIHELWTPTYDLNAAASQAWLIKAGRAAAITDTPTAGIVTSKVFDNCRAMARLFSGKRNRSVSIR